MPVVLTNVGVNYYAEQQSKQDSVSITRIKVGSYPVGGANPSTPSKETTGMSQVQYESDVAAVGKISDDKVIYSCLLDTDIGDFEITQVGFFSDTGVLVMIANIPTFNKRKTDATAGNKFIYSVILNLPGASETTGVIADPVVWQIDPSSNDLNAALAGVQYALDFCHFTDGQLSLLTDRTKSLENEAEILPEWGNTLQADIALAHKELQKSRDQRIQEGTGIIYNRGVINGCAVSSGTATRNIDVDLGKIFFRGQRWYFPESLNSGVVPENPNAEAKLVYVYLYKDGNDIKVDVTGLDEAVPEHGLTLYSISIPANTNATNDPLLGACTFTDLRRIEPDFPNIFEDPEYHLVSLKNDMPNGYMVRVELESWEGVKPSMDALEVTDKLSNGYKLFFAAEADSIAYRWSAARNQD